VINRRALLLGATLAVATMPRSTSAKVLLQPEAFAYRAFISEHRDPPSDAIRFVASSVFQFSSTSDATLGVAHLANLREFEDRGEIYVVDLVPIEDIPDHFGDRNWFVTYTIIAGAAAFETHHAHALFVTGNLLHEIEITGHDPLVTTNLLMDLASHELATSGNEQTLESNLVELEELPDDLELYREVASSGTGTEFGTPVSEDVPDWDHIEY
jgi:hypothetical protein